jgi:hypothetical protein
MTPAVLRPPGTPPARTGLRSFPRKIGNCCQCGVDRLSAYWKQNSQRDKRMILGARDGRRDARQAERCGGHGAEPARWTTSSPGSSLHRERMGRASAHPFPRIGVRSSETTLRGGRSNVRRIAEQHGQRPADPPGRPPGRDPGAAAACVRRIAPEAGPRRLQLAFGGSLEVASRLWRASGTDTSCAVTTRSSPPAT